MDNLGLGQKKNWELLHQGITHVTFKIDAIKYHTVNSFVKLGPRDTARHQICHIDGIENARSIIIIHFDGKILFTIFTTCVVYSILVLHKSVVTQWYTIHNITQQMKRFVSKIVPRTRFTRTSSF